MAMAPDRRLRHRYNLHLQLSEVGVRVLTQFAPRCRQGHLETMSMKIPFEHGFHRMMVKAQIVSAYTRGHFSSLTGIDQQRSAVARI